MYFDNYQRQNPPNITQKYQQPSVSLFHQQPVNNYESIQNSQRPYFNRRVGENPTVPSPVVAKNNQQQFYHNRPVLSFHTGTVLTNNSKQQSYQGKNNISFNHEANNSNYNRDNNESIKRRQSIVGNNFLRSNQQQSPINNKNISIENGVKNNMRMTMNIQINKNGQQGQKNQSSNNNTGNISYTNQNNIYKQKQYVSPQMIKQEIQKNTQKQSYYNSNSYSQLNFNQNKLSSKPYATGYKSGVENIDLGNKKLHQQYFIKQNNKQKSIQKDYHYNYQLKNTSSDLNIFNKTNPSSNEQYKLNEQYKYYTPSLSKQSSQKQDTSSLISRNTNNQQVFDYKSINVQKQTKLTDRQMNKSPSIDGLFNNGVLNKQKQNAVKRKNTLNQNTSSNYSNNYLSNNNYAINIDVNHNETNKLNKNQINKMNQNKTLSFNENKPVSSQNLPQENSKKNNKNYYALIQNLQKKFSQQKKSSENFQTKQKNYLQQINKKQQKIKRLQIIIQNNRQTINAMQETIKQLKKKNEQNKGSKQQISVKNGINNAVMMDQLRKQNNNLKQQIKKQKQQIKKQRKKSMSVSQQLILKQSSQKQTIQIKQLQKRLQQFNRQRQNINKQKQSIGKQKQLIGKQKQNLNKQKQTLNKQKQTLNNQISKLKQSNTIVQLNYSNQIKQHNNQRIQHTKTKQQIQHFKQQIQNLNKQIQNLHKQIQNRNKQIQNLNKQIQKLNHQKSNSHNSHQLLKSKQYQTTLLTSQLSLLKQKYQSSLRSIILLQEQIQNYKLNNHHQITQYKQKIQQLQTQVSKYKTKAQILQAQTNYKNMKIKTIQQKLSHKSHSQQLLNTNHLNNLNSNLMFQKQSLQSQVITLTNQLKTYQNMYSSFPKLQSSPNKNSDSAQIKTLQSYQSNKQSPQYKQTIVLLDIYHSKYQQIAALFNLSQNHQQSCNQTQYSSLTTIPQQLIMDSTQPLKQQASKQYLNQYHPLIVDQIKKIHKDMKRLVGVLKQCQTQSQNKSHKLYELDKTIKKQTNKINSLLGQIHLKSIAIIDINHMQLQKQIFKLNQKYQILNTVAF